MATKDSMSAVSSKLTTTPTGEESVTPISQLSNLGELSASMVTETDRRLEAIQRAQVGSLVGADKAKEPQEKIPKKLSPTLATRPKKYALEMWVEIKTSPGVYSTPEDDSYSINFVIDAINCAYPSCTGMYLDVAGHMLAFYGKKTNPRAGLLHDQGVIASNIIADIPSWMGYPAKLRVQYVSVSKASEILAGCKKLEKENWRQVHWDLQNRLSSMQLNSTLSATARPFQPQAASSSALVDDLPRDYPAWNGLARGSPTMGITTGPPVGRALLNHCYTSDPLIPLPLGSHFIRGVVAEEIKVTRVVVILMRLLPLEGGGRKRMGSLVRSRSWNLGARRVILTMWPMPLGNGPIALRIIMNTMRIPTLYP